MSAPDELATVDGTVKSVVFRNDDNGFTILHVTLSEDGGFRLAQREVTVLGTCAAAVNVHGLVQATSKPSVPCMLKTSTSSAIGRACFAWLQ